MSLTGFVDQSCFVCFFPVRAQAQGSLLVVGLRPHPEFEGAADFLYAFLHGFLKMR